MSTRIVSPKAAAATGTTGQRDRAVGAAWHLGWFAGVSLLAFLLPFLLTSIGSLHHDVYYLIYFAVTLAALALYVGRSDFDVRQRLRSRRVASLVIGATATTFVVWSVLAQVEQTPRPTGWYFAFELAWRGLAYGVVDALLLSAFPALVAWGLMHGRIDGAARRLAYGALSLMLVTVITVIYHVGYEDFRSRELVGPVVGNAVISAPVIATANPLGSIVAHAAMHIAAVTHAYESRDRLPPRVSAASRNRGSQLGAAPPRLMPAGSCRRPGVSAAAGPA
jgi:hypothetical protein